MKQTMTLAGILLAFALCLASCNGNSQSNVNVPTEYCEELVKLAEEGNAEAQTRLGTFLLNGNGVTKNIEEAIKWYQKAVEQGNAEAQAYLGVCYQNGNGVAQSHSKAVELYRKAAEQGNTIGQNNLGLCYDNGLGVEQSYTEAVKWYRKAAEQGEARSQYLLGICYLKGEGVEQSDSEGEKWLMEAANKGLADAQYAHGCMYQSYGDYDSAIGRFLQAALQGQKDAVERMNEWVLPKAQQGNASAQCAMGLFCKQSGKTDEAIQWFALSSQQGNKVATDELNKMK